MTRTPDAHFFTEARYRGAKVTAVAPDYAEYVKFADSWLPARAGTDAALAMAMTHVIVKEFYIDKPTAYFIDYAKRFTDLPFAVVLQPAGDTLVSGRFLTAADLGTEATNPRWKTVFFDRHNRKLGGPQRQHRLSLGRGRRPLESPPAGFPKRCRCRSAAQLCRRC